MRRVRQIYIGHTPVVYATVVDFTASKSKWSAVCVRMNSYATGIPAPRALLLVASFKKLDYAHHCQVASALALFLLTFASCDAPYLWVERVGMSSSLVASGFAPGRALNSARL
jgi:hypothetical protein